MLFCPSVIVKSTNQNYKKILKQEFHHNCFLASQTNVSKPQSFTLANDDRTNSLWAISMALILPIEWAQNRFALIGTANNNMNNNEAISLSNSNWLIGKHYT